MNNKVILFLDDSTTRAATQFQRWPDHKRNITTWVETSFAAIDVLDKFRGRLEEVHLDHDLGGTSYQHSGSENSGMEVIRWMEKLSSDELKAFEQTYFIIHSWNLPANAKMTERLQKLGLMVVSRPFGTSGY